MSIRTSYLGFNVSQNLFCIVQIYTIFYGNHPLGWPLVSSIDHGRRLRCVNSALWSICVYQTGGAGISGCWSTLSAKVLMRGVVFAAK